MIIFIFAHTRTTTFGYALTTNRKIILLNSENAYWNKKKQESAFPLPPNDVTPMTNFSLH